MSEVETKTPKSITLVWQPQLCAALGRSRYTIERWVSQSKFPAPIKVTDQGCAWRLRDVEAWLDKMARQRKRTVHRGIVKRQLSQQPQRKRTKRKRREATR